MFHCSLQKKHLIYIFGVPEAAVASIIFNVHASNMSLIATIAMTIPIVTILISVIISIIHSNNINDNIIRNMRIITMIIIILIIRIEGVCQHQQ